jgi:nucleotide-binding universal stress UspA family protein
MKILLAVDGSTYTRKMLEFVAAQPLFDERHEYTLLNAQAPLPGHASAAVGGDATRTYHEEEAQQVLAPALARLRERGFRVTGEWRKGPAADTIARCAEEGGYDLIVMGTHGHGALSRLVMGSVTTQVLARCTVPVLVVPGDRVGGDASRA